MDHRWTFAKNTKNSLLNLKKFPILLKNNGIISLKIINKSSGIVKINSKSSFSKYEKKYLAILHCFAILEFIMTFKKVTKRTSIFYTLTKIICFFELNTQNANTDLSLTKIATHITYRYVVKNFGGKFLNPLQTIKNLKITLAKGIKIIILPLEHYAINRDKNICLVAPNTIYLAKLN